MSVFNAYVALAGAIEGEVIQQERLSHRTTYRIGGPASLFVTVNTYKALVKTLDILERENVKWVVLGRGSNVLVSDEGYDGCVIKLGSEFSKIGYDEKGRVFAGAGVVLSRLVSGACDHGLTGLEFCVGIPGTVGGAVVMDAGTRTDWIGPLVNHVVVMRPGVGMVRLEGSQIDWGYRWTSIPADDIILEVMLTLEESSRATVAARMQGYQAKRRNQPIGKPCCGSVFRNPEGKSAGNLVEACGLKGFTVGGAQVSRVHCNFVVNNGGATAHDVVAVMNEMHTRVQDKFGIDLHPEVRYLGA